MAQKRMIMHISYITEPLSAALRTLFATLVLLVFPMGVWGEEVSVSQASAFGTLTDGRYTLIDGNTYTLTASFNMSDGYLYVPSGATVTLNLSSFTINRGLTTATTNGFVIKNEGTLTIIGTGTIEGGYNTGDGGGINSTGVLHVHGGTIQNNKVTGNGAGIYHNNTTAGSFTMQGAPVVIGNTANDVANNIYLPTGNVINISGDLTGSNNNIKVSMQTLGEFTSGLNASTMPGKIYKFASDDTTIGVYNASNEAKLQTNWSHLQDLINNVADETSTEFTLISGWEYKARSTETCLIIPSTKKITIQLNGGTLDRNLGIAKSDGSGCVIQNNGELTIRNSTGVGVITGGKNDNGGGIVNTGTLKIYGGGITGNTATGNGGAIYTSGTGTVNITAGSISNNTAGVNGGAICHTGSGTLTIGNGTFEENRATGNGGGIYHDSSSSMTMSGGTFSNNTSANGGGIYNAQGIFNFNKGTIWFNTATGNGGGVYNVASFSVTGGRIGSQNTAVNGGGIYNAATGILSVSGGQIEENTASANGGGIYADGTFNLSGNPTITNNTKSSAANNIYIPDGKKINIVGNLTGGNSNIGVSMESTTGIFTSGLGTYTGSYQKFKSDVSPYETDEVGSEAIIETPWKALKYKLATSGTYTLGKNYSPNAGIDDNVQIIVPNGINVTLNLAGYNIDRKLTSATTNGYVIQIENGGELTINGTTGTIKGGYNEGNGGGILNSGTLNIQGGTITGNRVSSGNNGAGIYNNGDLTMQGAPYISANYVDAGTTNPNNVYLTTAHHIITISDALSNTTPIGITMQTRGVFTSGLNSATGYQKFSSDNTTFETGNNANEAQIQTPWEGLQTLLNAGGTVTLTKNYTALDSDIGLVISSGSVNLNLGTYTIDRALASAQSNGYVVKVNSGANLTISGSGTIRGGNTTGNGGGILNEGTLTVTGGTITNSSAADGGGIYSSGMLTLSGGTLTENTASGNGAGVYNSGVGSSITGGSITSNTAAGSGGGIYLDDIGTLSIHGGTITNNTATTNGGGIYHNGTTLSLQGNPTIRTNYQGTSTLNNIYFPTGKLINISGTINNNSSSNKIGVTMQTPGVFTSGLFGRGGPAHFASDESDKGVGPSSDNEAVVGKVYTVNRSSSGNYFLVKGAHSNANAVVGEYVKIKMHSNDSYVPYSLSCKKSDETSVAFDDDVSYPEDDVDYGFIMPADNVTVTAISFRGGYCGASVAKNMKYVLNGSTLEFVTHDNNRQEMASYTQNNVPWKTFPYTEVNLTKVTNISDFAFYNSGLASANISQYVSSIGTKAFGRCTSLTSLTVDGDNSTYKTVDNVLFNKEGTTLICYPAGLPATSYTIPSGVNTIADEAFASNTHLTTIPSSTVANVGEYAFIGCSGLETVTLTGVSSIGLYAFSNLEHLTTVNITGSGTSTIETSAFGQCPSLTTVTLTDITNTNSFAFGYCAALTNLTITGSTTIGPRSFYRCTGLVNNITLTGVTALDMGAFSDCFNMTSITLPNTLLSIGQLAFENCRYLPSITIPASVTSINSDAFNGCESLTSITVDGGNNDYSSNDGILFNKAGTELICYPAAKTGATYTIPNTVTAIANYAFYKQGNLNRIFLLHDNSTYTIPTGGTYMFYDMTNISNLCIMVKKGLKTTYTSDQNWNNYSSRIYELDLENATISLTTTYDDYEVYDGNPKTPTVTVSYAGMTLDQKESGEDTVYDYSVAYTNNTDVGTATVTITGHDNYTGTEATKIFDIKREIAFGDINSYYVTYYASENLELPEGLWISNYLYQQFYTAHIVTRVNWENGEVKLSENLGYIPANIPVILQFPVAGYFRNKTFHLKKYNGVVKDYASEAFKPSNFFVGFDTPASKTYDELDDYYSSIYVLRSDKFYRATSGTLAARRCFIGIPVSSAPAFLPSELVIGEGDNATGIVDVKTPVEEGDNKYYDLNGQRVSHPKKGVYIMNGKKVVVK